MTIKLKINDQDVELTIEEAKRIYGELNDVFNVKPTTYTQLVDHTWCPHRAPFYKPTVEPYYTITCQ